mmetsp:Transcript_11118/g.9846  ORF Transcript_11118/g.9846 Transcript_11118/m.9846 type:complete len:101 (+) Transcript_11118:156-458(+)
MNFIRKDRFTTNTGTRITNFRDEPLKMSFEDEDIYLGISWGGGNYDFDENTLEVGEGAKNLVRLQITSITYDINRTHFHDNPGSPSFGLKENKTSTLMKR